MLTKAIILLVASLSCVSAQIQWNGNWAHACDFYGNDLSNARVSGAECGPLCGRTPGCTHFTWNTHDGGTCWMKKGSVGKDQAFYTGDQVAVCGVTSNPIPPGPVPTPGNLIWSSEFNSIDEFEREWTQETGGHGWGNGEAQYYTDGRRNVDITGGEMIIRTRIESYAGSRYTSARLISKKAFKYGFYEVRARVPTGRGIWPAFWLLAAKRPLNWPSDGEIDVMEYVGYQPGVVHGTIHCGAYNHLLGTQKGTSTDFNDNEYNLFQLDWKPNSITIMVNNRVYFQFNKESSNNNVWPFDNEFNIILNTAVGGSWGGAMGVDDGIFPKNFNIDYVRQYSN